MPETTILRAKNTGGYARPQSAGPSVQPGSPLPTVQVKMTGMGPQVQNMHQLQPQAHAPRPAQGYTRPAANRALQGAPGAQRPPTRQGHNNGALPTVHVQMTGSGPQVRSGGIPMATPESTWSAATARQEQQQQQQQPEPMFGPFGPLSPDQLLLCRHLLQTHLTSGSESLTPETTQLVGETIRQIDEAMLAIADFEALMASQPIVEPMSAPPIITSQQVPPAPPRVVSPRPVIANQRMTQISNTAPRRFKRPAPPVQVVANAPAPVVVAPSPAPVIDIPDDLKAVNEEVVGSGG